MDFLYAIFMGIIQGLTEFLPVSSSGHLAIFQHIFGLKADTGVLFEALLHLGTLAAVGLVFWKDVKNLVVHGLGLIGDACLYAWQWVMCKVQHRPFKKRRLVNNAYRKFALLIIVTSIPTAIIGFALRGVINAASSVLVIPGICLVVTAIILLLVDGRPGGKKKVKAATYGNAAVIGVAQGIATLPGISRSGSTIAACLFLGMDRSFAVRYSFLASVPAIVGANLLEIGGIIGQPVSATLIASYIVGMLVAAVVGYVCIKVMINIVQKSRYQYFAYYCAIIGIISIIAYFFFNK